jgi:hypothetical protein
MIYLEGELPLELDLYKKAVDNARIRTPGSFAYQLVKTAFPKHYCTGVTLGRKDLKLAEIEELRKQRKLPLVYVWGFTNPYEKPFDGEWSMSLGEKRIRAFIGKF